MPRPRLVREPCDCLDCREPAGGSSPPATASAAIARQEPPPKSLVLCLTGALQPEALAEAHKPHLDALVGAGWAGLLACRTGGPPLPHQLLGLPAAGEAPAQSLPDRFKQLRTVLLTDSAEVAQAGTLAGCYAVHQLGGNGSSDGGSKRSAAAPAPALDLAQPPADLAAHICRLLRVQPLLPQGVTEASPALAAVFAAAGQAAGGGGGKEEEEGDEVIDMLLLALDASSLAAANSNGGIDGSSSSSSSSSSSVAVAALEWSDGLVRALNQAPGFRETVLLSLVLGPGAQPLAPQPLLLEERPLLQPGQPMGAAAAAAAGEAAGDCPDVQRPLQSYQFLGQQRVEVDGRRPALVVHRLPAIIRVDRAARLDLAHIVAHGGAGAILAERLLPEVAYKLGRAPKYGA